MKRRDFMTVLGGATALQGFRTLAQVPARRPIIGSIVAGSSAATEQRRSGFPQGMKELGYFEGRDYVIEGRYGDGDVTRLAALVEELVRLKPQVILTGTTVAAREIERTAKTIPIVGVSLTDPVGFGLAASLAAPGGQVTGILIISDSFAGKQVGLALEVVPGARTIGMLVNAGNQSSLVHRRNVESAVGASIKFVPGDVHKPGDIDRAFEAFAREHVDLLLVPPDGLFVSESPRIVTLAAAARLPALYPYRELVEAGGLMSYGVDLRESWRRAATFVDKILKGAKPGDLPIEQPTNELVINKKAAQTLELTIPPAVLRRADQIIG